ncbi:MAG TPA: LytTR family DNA-binding domain-containing protein [Phnomibacter sp.]|nr:LytTR family DNA-binding domain-containing protein [Phnomibacter sp.]
MQQVSIGQKHASHLNDPRGWSTSGKKMAIEGSVKLLPPAPVIRYRNRVILRQGKEHLVTHVDDVAIFYTSKKVHFALLGNGLRLLLDQETLQSLGSELDPSRFFRLNRQCIVNIAFIKSFRAIDFGKLSVSLEVCSDGLSELRVSQEMAPKFKNWVSGKADDPLGEFAG